MKIHLSLSTRNTSSVHFVECVVNAIKDKSKSDFCRMNR